MTRLRDADRQEHVDSALPDQPNIISPLGLKRGRICNCPIQTDQLEREFEEEREEEVMIFK